MVSHRGTAHPLSSCGENASSCRRFNEIDRAVKAGLYGAMGVDQPFDWHDAAASALAWWDAAGVDTLAGDAPRDWRAPALPQPVADAAVPQDARIVLPMPASLEDFRRWRVGAAAPEADWGAPMIAPQGAAAAKLMILSDMPEAEDAARLFDTGAIATLFDRMLAALGLTREGVHIASLAAARAPGGRIPADAAARLADIARHHVALVAPERLLLFGQAAQTALFGADAPRSRLQTFNHDQAEFPSIATLHPRMLLGKPEWKALVWRDLQLLFQGMN